MTDSSDTPRDAAYFERMYAADPDPWKFATSDYERRKYDATLAALGPRRFAAGFEIGCSIGILTHRLAARCDRLLAVDIAQNALDEAILRCRPLPQVALARMQIPADWPAGEFDLVILSEVLYFLSPAAIGRTAALTMGSLTPGGVALLVNYTEPTGEACSGHEAAEIFIAAGLGRLALVSQHRDDKFRIDVLQAI